MFPFYTNLKHQNNFVVFFFSVGIKSENWLDMG